MQTRVCRGASIFIGAVALLLLNAGSFLTQAGAEGPSVSSDPARASSPVSHAAPGHAATSHATPNRRAAADYVSRALQAETLGKNSRRDALLEDAREAAPDFAPARWHSGYVWTDNRWMRYDDLSQVAPQNGRLPAYHNLRDKYHNTIADQLALAEWCKKARLFDEWRAHLGNVLALNPDHAEARAELGYQCVDGLWLTPHEIERAKSRRAAAIVAMNQWKPKLLAIRTSLQAKIPNRRNVARERLKAIQDAAAVPSIELVFCGDSEPMALAGVDKFADMTAADASLALARQALFSPWQSVRKAAVEKLKTRNRETFVPELLAATASPTESRMELYREPDGRLLYRHEFYQPGKERDELLVLDTMYGSNFNLAPYVSSVSVQGKIPPPNSPRPVVFDDGSRAKFMPNGTLRPDGPQTAYSQGQLRQAAAEIPQFRALPSTITKLAPANKAAAAAIANPEAVQSAALAQEQAQAAVGAAVQAQAREAAVANQNAQIAALNSAICGLLSAVTGVNGPQSPEDWSEWWAETDEVYVPGYKPLETAYVATEQTNQITQPVPMQATIVPAGPIHFSCLTAGTLIWTDAGPVAVEKIKVGDRVLSQDAETGELAYKPVLHTTVRLKAELIKLQLLDDTVTCSVGHGFWISGQGWTKAGNIQPGMNFHGAAGTTPLRHSEPAGAGAVYNLIVADFHSYFVGKDLIYSHDITARKPSDLVVPGGPARR